MKYNRITRRIFLQGMGGAVLGLPVLESLLPRLARGATPGGPRHFVAIKTYSGQIPADFYPQASNGNKYAIRDGTTNPSYTQDGTVVLTSALAGVSERTVNGQTFKSAPLSEFTTAGFSKLLGTDFNSYLGQISCLRGLDFIQSANHNQGGMLGYMNTANLAGLKSSYTFSQLWDTIDQVIANTAPFSQKPIKSLHFAPNYTNDGKGGSGGNEETAAASSLSFRAGAPIPFDRDPRAVFNRIMLGPGWGSPGGGSAPPPTRSLSNASLLDLVLPELKALTQSSRLSTEDRNRLDEHATYIADLQRRLGGGSGSGGGSGCTQPAAPTSRNNVESTDPALVLSLIRDTVDVAVAAIRCGITDVVTLDIASAICKQSGTGADVVRVHNPNGNNGSNNWHYLAHQLDGSGTFTDAGLRGEWTQLNRFVAQEVFLRVIKGLSVIESGSSSYLDNSIVLWGNELSYNHLPISIPTLIAGTGGGKIQTGRYIDYSDWSKVFFAQRGGAVVQGLAYNRLLLTILQAMGLSPSEYQKGNVSGYGEQQIMGGWESVAPNTTVPNRFSELGTLLPGLLI